MGLAVDMLSWRGRWGATVAAGLCGVLITQSAQAASPATVVQIPGHLVAGNQLFDASPAGFRAYLETLRSARPDLFAQLAPDANRLVDRVTASRVLLIGRA